MEILISAVNIEKDYQTIAVINWKTFDQTIKEKPEDYIFILTSDEWHKFMELDKNMRAGFTGKDNVINEAEYANQYQGIIVIASVAIQPDFVKKYKIGNFTHKSLGQSYAFFFINRSADVVGRSNAVLKRILDYKSNLTKKDNKLN